jgi:hypothetical protein
MESNFSWIDDRAKETAESQRELARAHKEYLKSIDDGIEHGVKETADRAEDSIEQLSDRIGETILKTQESAIVAEEFTRSMFDNISGLLDSIGDGSEQFGERLLGSFKKILADSATRQLFEYLASLGKQLSGSGSGGASGFFGTILTSLFGGGKAEGGPLDEGKWYIAGEKGPEPIWGGGPGAFAAGYGGSRGVKVEAPTYIDARGATMELTRALPEIMRRNNDQLEAKIIQGIKRRQYNLG